MNRLIHSILIALVVMLAGCTMVAAPATATPVPPTAVPPTSAPATDTLVPPTDTPVFTPIPTFTEIPLPTATPPFELDDGNKAVVFDFTARLCEANWMNGGEKNLPCPGDLNDPSHGYVGLLSGSDQGLPAEFAMVVMYPAQPSSGYGGIFGRFPRFKPGPFDVFKVSIACRSDVPCDIEFQLAYYDENGVYQDPYESVHYKQGDPPLNYVNKMRGLSGKSVELVLVVRPVGDPANAWALLIAPRILRP